VLGAAEPRRAQQNSLQQLFLVQAVNQT
jgi:hypothetical protein